MWLSEWSQLKLGKTKDSAISHTGHTRPRVTRGCPIRQRGTFLWLPEAGRDGAAPHPRAASVRASDPHAGLTVGRPSPSPNLSTPFSRRHPFYQIFFFFLIMRSTGGEEQQRRTNCTARSAGLETLNWFVGWLAGFSILTSSNLNSAGGQITAYIKYTKILLLKWK